MSKCPVCKKSEFIVVGLPDIGPETVKYIRFEFKVVKCNNCLLYFVVPEIDFSTEEWSVLYGSHYFSPKTGFYHKARRRARHERLNLLRYYNPDAKRFLDVGCGEGYVLTDAISFGLNAFGLDIYDNRVEEAKTKDINFKLGELPQAGYEESSFDIIYLDSVLEHVTDPLNYLEVSYRLLKPGGVLYAGVPNEDCLLNDFRQFYYSLIGKSAVTSKIKPFTTPYHIIGFNRSSLKFAFKKSGFKIRKLRNFAGRLQFLHSKPGSRQFFINLLTEPVSLVAFLIRREEYFEVYAQKPHNLG